MKLTLTLHKDQDWQWFCTGPGIQSTGHLDRDDAAWGNLAYGWNHALWGDAAPWVLAALEAHDRHIHGRADAAACEIVCAGPACSTQRRAPTGSPLAATARGGSPGARVSVRSNSAAS